MDTQDKKYAGYILFLILIMVVPLFNPVFNFKLFVHDFSETLPNGNSIFHAFTYHLGLMLQPTVFCWIVFTLTKGFWKIIFLMSFLWYLKDCVDVIINNNQAMTIEFDLFAYAMIIVITILWAQLRKRN